MSKHNIELVESYLAALREKDLTRAPVSDDVLFEDPLTTPQRGVEAWKQFVGSMLPAIKDVRVKQHVAEGDYVATLWEADTLWGVIPIFELFRIVDGRITEAKAFLDPRPITNQS